MLIDPAVHDRFVAEFGLNMLNTLTLKENRLLAHRRRIFVFDERGGMIGGDGGTIQEFQNLTTGVFHSRTRRVVGVRYRCRPHTMTAPEVGAFHTHPAAFTTNMRLVRQRIESLLWLSDMDVKAFRRQHELYGFEWHFIGTLDIGCFHIDDVVKGLRTPREVVHYHRLEEAVQRLAPQIRFYDQILQRSSSGTPSTEILEHILQNLTESRADLKGILHAHDPEMLPHLAGKVANQFQLLGYSGRQVSSLLRRSFGSPDFGSPVAHFQDQLRGAYDRLSALVP